ncbi:MAG TPA: methyltransferase domain-containing protein [Bryobacteraceae bacterium]|jgi:trans-aconitate 2-methyltransferase|nr:methyltransferase domain-containing protein [Bryobacteraceae bacterium]
MMVMAGKLTWDAELYEARHGFVWELGAGLVDLLDPKPGERILDLGCGPGQLTNTIAGRGAAVMGLDSSPAMIGQARQNFPELSFILEDAAAMEFDEPFDAVFSNAALHWMLDAEGVARAITRVLRRGGRFVAELGGKRNIRTIVTAIEDTVARYAAGAIPLARTYFPALGEYSALLEGCGLEVRTAQLFDRPTALEGTDGMANWIRQFKWYYFEGLPAQQRKQALEETVDELRPALYRDGQWIADYRRLRVMAVKE